MGRNIIQEKTFKFALCIIEIYRSLCESEREYTLSKQLLRSGTSIGANVRESINAQSRRDFINKFSIAQKEVSETEYWLELLIASNYLDIDKGNAILQELHQIDQIIKSIIITTKRNVNAETK